MCKKSLCCVFTEDHETIYGNVTPAPARHEVPGSGKWCGYCLVIALSTLLFLSLVANVLLTYFYVKFIQDSDTLSVKAINCSAGDENIKNEIVTSHEKIRRCSAGEHQIQYKDSLYIFTSDEISWISSKESCQELGGDLLIVNSKEEHNFLINAMNTFGNSLHWIGLTNAEKDGRWRWVDGTPLMQNLSWWTNNLEEMASEREDCAGYYDGKWVALSCSSSERGICKISCTH